MYYIIEDNEIRNVKRCKFAQADVGICIMTLEEWNESGELLGKNEVSYRGGDIGFCKLERHSDYLFGTIHIPPKKNTLKSKGFAFYIFHGKIAFIDDTDIVWKKMQDISAQKLRKNYNLGRFVYDFMGLLIEEDLLYLEIIEKDIAKEEERILSGHTDEFNYRMLQIKKKLATLHRYYSQLAETGEELADNKTEFFEKDDEYNFEVFTARVSRLGSETQVLREYAMQVQEVYQSEIGIRQNDVMKILTIVTTIFLPLTLLAGWYGMNFRYMPELACKYGYLAVIIAGIIIVIVELVIFKKKKFW